MGNSNRQGLRTAWLCGAALLAISAGLARAQRADAPGVEPEIKAYFDWVNRIWASGDLSQLPSVLGNDAALILHAGGKAVVLDRAKFAAATQKLDLTKMGLASHVVEPAQRLRRGDLVLCFTKSTNRLRDGRAMHFLQLHVLHRTPVGWRMAFAMPCFARLQVVVGKVLANTQAERAGVQAGDVVVSYAGAPIRQARDLVDATRAHSADREIHLVVRRAGRAVTCTVSGGLLGMAVHNVLVPEPDASSAGPDVEAVKATLRALAEQVRRKDVAGLAALLSTEGFVDCKSLGDKATISSRQSLIKLTQQAFASDEDRWESFAVRGIRVIRKGPLALAEADYSLTRKTGGETKGSILQALVRRPEGWRIVANITRLAHIRIERAANDEAALRTLALTYVGTCRVPNPVPPERVAAFLADDIDFVWSNGRAGKGKKAFLERLAKGIDELRTHFTRAKATYDIRSVRVLGDAAIVHGLLRITGTLKEGQRPYDRPVWMTLIFRRTAGGWRLVHEHSSKATLGDKGGGF